LIFLHTGQRAEDRVKTASRSATGDVYVGDRDRLLPAVVDEIASWLKTSARPTTIALFAVRAASAEERAALRTLRRIAKFRGVDVHLAGADDVAPIADRVVGDDGEAGTDAPDGAAAVAARLIHDERMGPFERTNMDIPTWEEIVAASGCDEAEARARVDWMAAQEVWVNNLYQVNVEYGPDRQTAHLIIRRLDRQPIRNWQHFQTIKNDLLGPECEAVELYPPESHLVDEKHHYHLWGFTRPGATFGVGFRNGRRVDAPGPDDGVGV